MTSAPERVLPERVLVVSIDGLAPRVITPATMPNLCDLARSGGSCFTARTVVPPITVPAHASMFRGIAPEAHGLVDNTPIPPHGDAPSFLAAARAAGRTTASVLCWLPLDQLIEPKAARYRVTLDSGYDPYDDDVVTAETIDLLQRYQPDVTLTYLVSTDLAGHAHGWGSDEYLADAARIDVLLGQLVAAAGPDSAIVVTTDHGGVDRNHFEPLADTLETFVVVRSSRDRTRIDVDVGIDPRHRADRRRPGGCRGRAGMGGLVVDRIGAVDRRSPARPRRDDGRALLR